MFQSAAIPFSPNSISRLSKPGWFEEMDVGLGIYEKTGRDVKAKEMKGWTQKHSQDCHAVREQPEMP